MRQNYEETISESVTQDTPAEGSKNHLADRLSASIKSMISIAALGVASGCSTQSQYRTHPTDANLRIVSQGNLYYSPPRQLGHGESPRPEGNINRSVLGAGIGYLTCRILGASSTTGIGCAIVGWSLGSQLYDRNEMDRRDYHQLQEQIVAAYKHGTSSAPKITDNNTRYVSVLRKGMIGKVYHIRFKVEEVNNLGRVSRLYFVHATLRSGLQGNAQPLYIIDPLPFPDEKEFPLR